MRPLTMRLLLSSIFAAVAMAAAAGPAAAQIGLPGGLGGGLPRPPGLPGLPVDPGALDGLARERLDGALQAPARLRGLIRQSGGALEADPHGWPVVRGEVAAVDLTPEARRRALAAGFTVVREERLAALDMTMVVLAPPRGLSLRRAVERLRDLDPQGKYAFNHVHAPAGDLVAAGPGSATAPGPQGGRGRMGLIDTGVDVSHPAVAGARIVQRGFAGPARAAPHGTAVASLMVGRSGAFSGAAPGRELYAA
ncbi:MAG: S8 family serine peptidase, partial [Brevundimonas sp.]